MREAQNDSIIFDFPVFGEPIKMLIFAKFKSKLSIDLKFLISRLFINVLASSTAPFILDSTF